ncbi:MAG: hypothetical protein KBT36_09330 [Kurthia sp.]|nr:hypothetical protein [Candidatus Kurthia equi]
MIAIIIVSASVTIYILKLRKDIKIGKMYNEQAESLLNEYTRAFRYISRTHKGLVNEAFDYVNEEDKRG